MTGQHINYDPSIGLAHLQDRRQYVDPPTTTPQRYRFRVEAWEDDEYVVTDNGKPISATMKNRDACVCVNLLNELDRNYLVSLEERK